MSSKTWVHFYERFTCGDYLNATNGVNYYKFITEDENSYTDETSSQNFTLDRDNATVSFSPRSNSTVRRIGDNQAFLEIIIYDSDYGVYPSSAKGSIYVTRDGSTYDVAYPCTSNNGNCSNNHNPYCNTTVGVQIWTGGTNDTCYEIINSTSSSDLTVYGSLKITVARCTRICNIIVRTISGYINNSLS